MAVLGLERLGADAALHHPLSVVHQSGERLCRVRVGFGPEPLGQGGGARPQPAVQRLIIRLLRPERRRTAQHLRGVVGARRRPLETLGDDARTVVVDGLPALVGRAPVVAVADPGGEAAVQVPGVVVGEDQPITLAQQVADLQVVTLGPDLPTAGPLCGERRLSRQTEYRRVWIYPLD